ncbi:DUF1822 family protein [Aerosakkonema funiforme]|uniref:DUF1822 family protein n=1 Tax=Aerosakkonema funiforme TaxID=1246630 RepID=UPI0035BB042A
MLVLKDIIEQFPEQVWLQFSPKEVKTAWPSDREYSYDAARWNAYLNRLCLNNLIPWIQEETRLTPQIWPSDRESQNLWEFVNGAAITIGKTRLILIPSEVIDIEEFYVQQEWIDIPSWAGDYYLAIQVNPDDGWLRVWGYATHQQLKSKGIYDNFERTYCLKREDIIENVDVLWIAIERCLSEKSDIKHLPNLSVSVLQGILAQLSQPSFYSPRLDVNFEQWAFLLDDRTYRQQLYEQRVKNLTAKNVADSSAKLVNLSQWFQDVFEAGWQTVEQLFGTEEGNLAFQTRSISLFREEDPNREAIIKTLLQHIYQGKPEHQRKQAAEKLGEIGTGNQEAIAGLIHLISTTGDEETRWTAAESLWMIDPGNPTAGVRKAIDLGMLLAEHPIALIVAILQKADRKVAVLLRLYPMKNQKYLPPNLKLIVMDDAGNTFLEAEARSTDNCIQLKFTGSREERFCVKVALGEANITENFVI